MNALVTCRSLSKEFGSLRAIDDGSFEVQKGEIFGIIGPNGAGKTTLLSCLEGLDRPRVASVSVVYL